jgi:predicted DNA binding CopG/RHH family protein
MVTFELRPKDKTVSLRLPDALLEKIRNRAATIGMPAQRFMRLALEKAVIDDLKR